MKRVLFFMLSLWMLANATVVDDYYTYLAQRAYKKGELKKSFIYYAKIRKKSDAIVFNMANILYQMHRYQEAIILYEKIASLKLLKKKWYNLANSYAQIGHYEKAVFYYKKVLQNGESKSAKENLTLVKNEIKKIEQALKDKQQHQLKRKGKDFKGLSSDLELKNSKMTQAQTLNLKYKDSIADLMSDSKRGQLYFDNLSANSKMQTLQDAKEGLTTKEEKKWDRLLREKNMDSLVIPLSNKGGASDNYPW